MIANDTSLKDKIEKKGINKSWLARKLEVPQSTLSHYLNGTRSIPEEIANQISNIIG